MAFWFGVAVGLVVGWNVLPQPEWAKKIYDKVLGKFKKDEE